MTKPRARDLGLPFPGQPGPFNAITDVPGEGVFSRARPEKKGPPRPPPHPAPAPIMAGPSRSGPAMPC